MIQGAIILAFLTKYLFPKRMRNTHSKILAFLFVLNTLNLYKQKKIDYENGEISHWIVFGLNLI